VSRDDLDPALVRGIGRFPLMPSICKYASIAMSRLRWIKCIGILPWTEVLKVGTAQWMIVLDLSPCAIAITIGCKITVAQPRQRLSFFYEMMLY
jgi:hypothetical protein